MYNPTTKKNQNEYPSHAWKEVPRNSQFQQHQENNFIDKELIPNRELLGKRGVFPYAIHTNMVSKPEVNDEFSPFVKPKITHVGKATKMRESIWTKFNHTKGGAVTPQKTYNNVNTIQQTPVFSSKQPIFDASFSNCSNSTEMNKNILLKQYLIQQYEAIAKPCVESKYINFDADEAFQNRVYEKIGDVLNNLFLEVPMNSEDATDMTLLIQKKLRNLYVERKYSNRDILDDIKIKDKHEKTFKTSKIRVKHEFKRTQISENDRKFERSPEPIAAMNSQNIYHKKYIRNSHDTNKLPPKSKTAVDFEAHIGWRKTSTNSKSLSENDKLIKEKSHGNYLSRSKYKNFSSSGSCSLMKNSSNRKSSNLSSQYGNFNSSDKETQNVESCTSSMSYTCHRKHHCEEMLHSPSLFFCDESSAKSCKKIDARPHVIANNYFSLDSAAIQKNIEPQNEKLLNPIEFLKHTVGRSKSHKNKHKRKKSTKQYPRCSESASNDDSGEPFEEIKKRRYSKSRSRFRSTRWCEEKYHM